MSVGRRGAISNGATTGTSPGGAAGGDLSGTYPNPKVSSVTPASGNVTVTLPSTSNYISYKFTGWGSGDEVVRFLTSGSSVILDNVSGGTFSLRNSSAGATLSLNNTGSAGHVNLTNTGAGGDIALSSVGTGNSITMFASGSSSFIYAATNDGRLLDGSGNPIARWNASNNIFVKPIIGSTTETVPLQLGYLAKTWPSDANYTLTSAEYIKPLIALSGGSLGATRDLIVPLTAGAVWWISNQTTGGQSVRVIGASGTGITIATAKSAWVMADGTNIVRMTADV